MGNRRKKANQNKTPEPDAKRDSSHHSKNARNPDLSIEAYESKRDFTRTDEPVARRGKSTVSSQAESLAFVVHRHEARRLHYDLRLECSGVLKCFAVPRGFSYVPGVKHLAVNTEDHPLAYTEFKGRIPRGEYGGGTMLIWDEGTYDVLKAPDVAQAIANGEVKLVLRGRRLRGEWHLVCTNREKSQWLLFKSKDRYAREVDDFVSNVDLSEARHRPPPKTPGFMEAGRESSAFIDYDYVFEMELDGYRVFADLDVREDSVRLLAGGKDIASDFPHIVQALKKNLRAERAIVDGVIVAMSDEGIPNRDMLESGQGTVVFYALDLIYYDEWDVRVLPLTERKALLHSIIKKNPTVLYADHVSGNGRSLAQAIAKLGGRGMIARRSDAPYKSGRVEDVIRIAVDADLAKQGSPEESTAVVAFRNLDKVYWPEHGYTKGDLISYYGEVADLLLPFLRDRPIHMLRYPDGIHGKWFYQKQVMDYVPDWIQTIVVSDQEEDEEKRYMMVNDRATLLYLVNLGSIDLHPWMSRRDHLEEPDITFIDLDPKEAPFSTVVRLAREIGKLLRGIGLAPYVKTSGKSGMHICIPLIPGYTYEQARMFCEGVCRVIAREYPDIATVERSTGRRGRRVYLDFMQNRREQTIVPPYVVRPVVGATVSMPIEWDELTLDLSPGDFHIKNAMQRLSRSGDLFQDFFRKPQNLLPAIQMLEKYLQENRRGSGRTGRLFIEGD